MGKAEEKRALLLDKAGQTTTSPGVYRMLDNNAQIIYIGKAKNLRNRVRHYFQAAGGDDHPKTRMLISKIHDFEITLTESEAEALILESILIKKHKPRYNIALKDDKSYPYLLIDRTHTYPKLVYGRRFKKKKKLDVYGPYVSAGSLRRAIQFLNQSFKLRDCKDNEFANRSRPCINHQIGTCTAPCVGLISPEDYASDLETALKLLRGQGKDVLRELESRMEQYARNEEFELAAKLRDQVHGLQTIFMENEQNIQENSRNRLGANDRDIVGLHRQSDSACFAVVFVRNGQVIDTTNFYVKVMPEDPDEEILFQFLAQFYLTRGTSFADEAARAGTEGAPGWGGGSDTGSEEPSPFLPGTEIKRIPPEIVIPIELGDQGRVFDESLERLGFSTHVLLPKRGAQTDLMKMAERNAADCFVVEQAKLGDVYKALSDLKARLNLSKYPRRIECFDISNLGDTDIVASRVVFIEGKPEKSLYRHYKMRETTTQNDFAAMREVLGRRLQKSSQYATKEDYEDEPDLLVVDGGKGQLGMAMEVIKELNITGLDVVALAKAKSERNFESDEVKGTQERVFKPGRMNPIVLMPGSNACHMMQRVRDEAHRFAITFQRAQRGKQLRKP